VPRSPAHRRAEQAEASRAHIAEVALQMFAEHGFTATSTRRIAERAGVSEGLVFHHFPTKVALLEASVGGRSVLSDRVVKLMHDGRDAPATEQIRLVARGFVELLGTDRVETRLFRMLLSESRTNDVLRETFHRTNERVITAIATYLEARIAAGELRADLDPATAAQALLGAFLWFFVNHDHLDRDPWRERATAYADEVVELWLRGARSEPDP